MLLCPVAPLSWFPGILFSWFLCLLLWFFVTSWARAIHVPLFLVSVCVECLSSSKPSLSWFQEIPLLKSGYISWILFWRRMVVLNLVEVETICLELDCVFYRHISSNWGTCHLESYSPYGLGSKGAKTYGDLGSKGAKTYGRCRWRQQLS